MGHNYIHAGADSINWEVTCASWLCKVTLKALGFTDEEIIRFMETTETELLELTWHKPTPSTKALRSAQKRTKTVFDVLQSSSSRHDVTVSDVEYRETNGKPGLLVLFKGGDGFRQYGKADQIASRAKRDRNLNWISAEVKQHLPLLKETIQGHLRNELINCGETLKEYHLEHPWTWTRDSIADLIDARWKAAGLDRGPFAGEGTLSAEAAATLERCEAGEKPGDFLPSHTHTRHRQSILDATGIDIDDFRGSRRANFESVSRQMRYGSRWEPKGELRKLVLCEQTAPAIIEELERGYAFLENGEIPEFSSAEEQKAWLEKWTSFAARENGGRNTAPAIEMEVPSLLESSESDRPRDYCSIADIRINPYAPEDQLIWYEGEWLLI